MSSLPILKTYPRQIDPDQESYVDKLIEEHIQSSYAALESGRTTPQKHYAYVLSTFITFSSEIGIRSYAPDAISTMLELNPPLLKLVEDCVKEGSFVKIRNLEIFKPLEDPENIVKLRKNHVDLFQRLSIFLTVLNKWQPEDIAKNGGSIHTVDIGAGIEYATTDSEQRLSRDIKHIRETLRKKRLCPREHLKSRTKSKILIDTQKEYPSEFNVIFDKKNGEVVVNNHREYRTLFNAQSCFVDDAVRCAGPTSSSFKASTFNAYLIHPSVYFPTFASDTVVFRENGRWSFPLFVGTPAYGIRAKYTPRSDWSFDLSDPLFPLAISGIVSQKNESDENRMLIQAIAASRAGNYFLKPSTTSLFFIVAIYLTANMKVRRYIVQPETKEPNANVNILQETFNLANRKDVSLFLLEMFNLSVAVESLTKDFDSSKKGELLGLHKEAKSIMSLTHAVHLRKSDPPIRQDKSKSLSGMPEGEEDAPTPFHSIEIGERLEQFGFKIGGIDAFNSNIALVVDKTGDPTGCLKFLSRGSKESEILQYLQTLKSPFNHSIQPICTWPYEQDTVVLLPMAGNHITELHNLSDHLWGICRQLVEGVQFLHQHGVAHLDLKPQNVLVPVTYGFLTIIDFGVSVRFTRQEETVQGLVGTKGYIAPEVGYVPYDPLRADLFSCGVTIRELCELVHPSAERSILWSIASDLMDPEPTRRPMMSQILTRLDEGHLRLNKVVTASAIDIPLQVPVFV